MSSRSGFAILHSASCPATCTANEGGGRTVTPEMTIWEFCEIERFQNTYAKYLWGFDFERFDFVGITENYASGVEVCSGGASASREMTKPPS